MCSVVACEFVKELCKHSGDGPGDGNKSNNKSNAIKIKALRAVTTAGQTIAEHKEGNPFGDSHKESTVPWPSQP